MAIESLQEIVRDRQSVLDLLLYRCDKMEKEGADLKNQIMRV